MNYHQAQHLLDLRRAGADVPEAVVTKALETTGDLTPEYTVADAVAEMSEA